MLQQMQQIRQLQEMQQRQDMEERLQRVRQQQEQLYQQRRNELYQQHQRRQEEIRRQNQQRFIQHMTQQPAPRLQLGQSTVNVQTPFPAAPHTSFVQAGGRPYQSLNLRFQLPAAVRLAAPTSGSAPAPAPAPGNPPTINLTLGPATQASTARTLRSVAQVSRLPVTNAPK